MPDNQPGDGARARELAEAWSWAHEAAPASPTSRLDPSSVTAVMVVHNGEEWLGRQLDALAALDPAPGRLICVDADSSDGSSALLADAQAEGLVDEVLVGPPDRGFGHCVSLALESRQTPEWIWLLHDDSAPVPDALARLLEGAERERADIVVPKLLEPKKRNYPDQVQEIGQTISRHGRRVLSVEPGDLDHQQDEPEAVLGASTAGLLVSGPAWDQLGGFDPAIPAYRDGVELGWRANLMGMRVTTWPAAALHHVQAGRAGWRASQLAQDPDVADRVAAMRLVAAHSNHRLRAGAGLVASSLARSLGMLLGKSPSGAWAELVALREYWRGRATTAELRERVAEAPHAPGQRVQTLRPGAFQMVRHTADRWASAVADRYRDMVSDDLDTGLDDLTGDDFSGGQGKARLGSPVLMAAVTLLVATLLAGRGLIGASGAFGGGMLPAPESVSDAWAAYLRPDATLPGSNATWLLLAAVGSSLVAGQPWLYSLLGLLLAPILAGWAMVSLLRKLIRSPGIWGLLGLVWGGVTLVTGLVGAGAATGLVAAIALPHAARCVISWASARPIGAERWRAPASTAGWLILLTAVLPVVWLVALVGCGVWAALDRRRVPEALVAIGGSGLFFAAWAPRLAAAPGRLLTGIDPLASAGFVPELAGLPLGRITTASAPTLVSAVFFGVIWLVFLLAMLWSKAPMRQKAVVFAVAGLGFVAAALLPRLSVAVSGGWARPDGTVAALLAFGAMLVGVALGLRDGLAAERPQAARVAAGLALVAALAGLGFQAVFATSSPVRARPELLPPYVRDIARSERASRALLLEVGRDKTRWMLVQDDQPRWGSGERDPVSPSPRMSERFAVLAQSLAQGRPVENLDKALSELGVSHIWIRGASPELVATISNAVGLTRAAADERTNVWTVAGLVSRARVVDDDSEPVVDGLVPPGSRDRRLVIAEPPDPRWRAWLDDQSLTRSDDGETLAFELPARAGRVRWGMAPDNAALVGAGAVAFLLAVLAAPVASGGVRARRVREA